MIRWKRITVIQLTLSNIALRRVESRVESSRLASTMKDGLIRLFAAVHLAHFRPLLRDVFIVFLKKSFSAFLSPID